ncbi:MAG: CHAT domain-containing protein [Chitinophagaceae bacterium]
MKHLLLTITFLFAALIAKAQHPSLAYLMAWKELRAGNLDTALIMVDKASEYYSSVGKTDSLTLALALKTTIVWEKSEWTDAKHVADTAVQRTFGKLPSKSEGRVFLNAVMGGLYASKYDFDSARLYYSQALKAADTTKTSQSLTVLYNNLCKMATLREDAATSDYYFQKAYNCVASLEGKDAVALIDILLARMQSLIVNEKYNETLQIGFDLEKIILKHYQNDNIKLAKNYANISTAFYYLSRYEDGLLYRQRALHIYQLNKQKGITNTNSFYATYCNIGQLYYYLHEYTLAHQHLEKALHLGTKIFGRKSLGLINILVQYATSCQKLGRFNIAHQYFDEAYIMQHLLAPEDQRGLAYIETFYGDLFIDEGKTDSSIVYYQRSMNRYKTTNETNSYYGLYNKSSLAGAYVHSGRYTEALGLQKNVLYNFRKHLPQLKQPIIDFLNDITETYLKMNLPDSAKMYSDSVFLYQSTFKHLTQKPIDWLHSVPFSYKVCEQLKTRIAVLDSLYQQSKNKNHLKEIISLVECYADYAASNIYALRTQNALVAQSAINKAIFSAGIDACWRLAQNNKSPNDLLKKAFTFSEQSKAMLLRLASNSFLVDDALQSKDETIRRDIAFRKTISALNEQYYNAEDNRDSLLHLLTTTIEAYKRFQDSLKQTGNSYFKKRYALDSYTISEFQHFLLQEGQTLLEYASTPLGLYTFVLSKDSFYVKHTDALLTQQIMSLRHTQSLPATKYTQYAYYLYQQLLQPVEPYFTSDKLIVIPDAELYYINFESLVTDREGQGYASLQYIINKYSISYLLSANTAIQLNGWPQKTIKNNKALVFAPVFTDEMKLNYKKHSGDDSSFLTLFRQPFALQAAQTIKKILPTDLYTEQRALEDHFKQAAADYKILHLGTHAQVDNEDPLQSKLFFARSFNDSLPVDDGVLYAYEIYPMQLHAQLAVLTACETGGGSLQSGEGVMSLAYSFMFAGCPSVVMSLWQIDEKTNAEIIAHFYRYLKKGNNKNDALRKAKRDFLHQHPDELANPFYWSGLCIIGDTSPTILSSNGQWLYYVVSVFIIVLEAVWVIYFLLRKVPAAAGDFAEKEYMSLRTK